MSDDKRFTQWLQDYEAERMPDDMNLWYAIESQVKPVRRTAVISRVGWLVAVLMIIMTTAGVYALDQIINNQVGDKGMDAVTEQGKVAELYITNEFGGDYELKVTLETIYADSNRIFVTISASGTASADDPINFHLNPHVILPNGDELPFLGFGGGGGGGGGGGESDRVPFGMSMLTNFDASIIETTDTILPLIIKAELAYSRINDAEQGMIFLGETQFDVEVPFNQGVTLTPDQTMAGDGVVMHLQKVVIAPSLTRLELCYIEPAQPEGDLMYVNVWQPMVSLSVSNEAVLENLTVALSELDYNIETGCYTYNITEALDSYAGDWELTVDRLIYQLTPPTDELQQAFDDAGLPFVAMGDGAYMLATSEDNPRQPREDVPEDYEELEALNLAAQTIYEQWQEKIEGAWTFTFTVPEA